MKLKYLILSTLIPGAVFATEAQDPKQKAIESWAKQVKEEKIEIFTQSPLGDDSITDIYSPFVEFLKKTPQMKPEELKKLIEEEKKMASSNADSKPFVAGLFETEMAHMARDICTSHPWCMEVGLYSPSGEGLLIGARENFPEFREPRDPYTVLGFLGPDPKKTLGVKKYTDKLGVVYYEIVKGVYYNKADQFAFTSPLPAGAGEQVLGYIQYVVQGNLASPQKTPKTP